MNTDELILWCAVGFALGMMSDESTLPLMVAILTVAVVFRLTY